MSNIINAVSGGSGGVSVTGDTSGQLVLQTAGTTAVTVNSSQQTTFANTINTPNTFGFKNRIINGAMVINQRALGTFTPTTGGSPLNYSIDRWTFQVNQNSKLTTAQSSTAPTGFNNSLLVTSSSAYTPSGTDYFALTTRVEAYNTADLGWGTANAKTVTLSFQVYSSLTGTFGGNLASASNRSYPFTYTISSANTWTTASVTIAGDTSGTWLTTNGLGIELNFSMGMGSTYGSGTAGAWTGTWSFPSGCVSVVGTNGATFYITGVQLEVGTQATSFDYRPYGTELALCQRYALMATNGIQNGLLGFCNGSQAIHYVNINCPVPLRASPSVTQTVGAAGGGPSNNASNLSVYTGVSFVFWSSNGNSIHVAFSLNSTPSQQACMINPNTGYVFLSSEL